MLIPYYVEQEKCCNLLQRVFENKVFKTVAKKVKSKEKGYSKIN